MRPLRPDESKSRPTSTGVCKPRPPTISTSPPSCFIIPNSVPVMSGDGDYDEPPPLPEKLTHADYANISNDEKAATSAQEHHGGVLMRRKTHKDRVSYIF